MNLDIFLYSDPTRIQFLNLHNSKKFQACVWKFQIVPKSADLIHYDVCLHFFSLDAFHH